MVHIVGGDVHYSFDKTTGTISNAAIGGSSRLQQGPVFNVWRAPLANDMDNWSSWTFKGSKRTPGLGHGRDNHWRTLGVDKLTLKCVDFQSQADDDATCKVIVHQLASTPDRNTEFELKWTYLFAADGSVRVSITVIPHGTMPDWLPRVGIQVLLPGNCDQIQWYGRGPFENYPDRKTGARVGIYSSTAREEYVPYLTPQDYGNKSDVRWLIVTDEQGRGWRIAGDGSSLFNFSTHIYGSDNLERAMYPFQLVEADHMVLNLDHRVSGVGDTSKSTLQQYRVPPDVYTFSFVINPLSP
jgi:beta-galactosidase